MSLVVQTYSSWKITNLSVQPLPPRANNLSQRGLAIHANVWNLSITCYCSITINLLMVLKVKQYLSRVTLSWDKNCRRFDPTGQEKTHSLAVSLKITPKELCQVFCDLILVTFTHILQVYSTGIGEIITYACRLTLKKTNELITWIHSNR